jgi:hypothetical protein
MKPPHNDSIWPDDTQRAAVTLALAAATNTNSGLRGCPLVTNSRR